MDKTIIWLCVYYAIIGTGLWLTFFLALGAVVCRMTNRYDPSVPVIMVDKVGTKAQRSLEAGMQDGSKNNATIIFKQEKEDTKTQNYQRY